MIIPSEFDEIIAGGLSPVVLALQETFNGEDAQPKYNFRDYLGRRYSVDGTWKTLGLDNGLIAADIIALDSPLPVKSRKPIQSASGEIPKIGTELAMNESDRKQLRLLSRAGGDLVQVQSLLFSDVRRVYGGVLEQIEYRFLQGLSSGVIVTTANGNPVGDQDNVGLGVIANLGYTNLYNASVIWGNPGYTALGDLVATYNASTTKGSKIIKFLMTTASKNLLLNSDDAKGFVANYQGNVNNGTVPTMVRLNEALQSEYGFTIETIDRSITIEINGVERTFNPWEAGQVIGLTQQQVGTLVWSDVEEMSAPVSGVFYQRAEEFILISQYRTARPSLKQWTGSQAVALPVINQKYVYKLDTTAIA